MHIAFEGFDLFNHGIDVGFIIKTLNLNHMINYANQCQNQKAYINTNNIIKNSCIMFFFSLIKMGANNNKLKKCHNL